jgi:pimeloyl-ACP methyl ester carboxylesterase
MVESSFIQIGNDKLHFVKAGKGDHTLLLFHGFGQDHSVYLNVVQALRQHYTLYIFDLYFHGKSEWSAGEKPLDKSHWKKTMNVFLAQTQIQKFAVAGFSLGGKFALASLECFPEKCSEIFLMAPDGINTSFWYSLATYPIALRKLFKSLIRKPGRFMKLARALNKFNLVDKGLIRFAEYQMNTEEKRKRVYYSWVVFRHLTFNLTKVKTLISENKIRVTVIVGRYDKVIEAEKIKKFVTGISDAKLVIIETGHNGLLTAEVLGRYLVPLGEIRT